ncbi:hypothetical protein GOP47_0016557 [Adiantum capillus-veneris]|uniref:OVATE domain-containing protein n=1 Tax=Adiantum capillus-veneris TaxID=13818 RepID=A0A9D4ZBU6_ADICA|nr:hypothetical protein GOP47_0016557 [Adiantum capillus-veneris]
MHSSADPLKNVFIKARFLSSSEHMMPPSWFTKLRDVKSELKHSKQQDKPHESPQTACKKRQVAPVSLAKSLSLRRASSKARNTQFEGEIIDAYRSEDNVRTSFSGIESDLYKSRPNARDSPPPNVLCKETTGALSIHDYTIQLERCQSRGTSPVEVDVKNASSQDNDVQSFPNFRVDGMSKLQPDDEESQACTQKVHNVSDTDTEEFSLMSETSSTFGSETSSGDSSVSSKCSTCEEGHQNKSSEYMQIIPKKMWESGSLVATAATNQQGSILYELQGRRQYCFSPIGVGGDGGDDRTFPSDANKGSPISSKARKDNDTRLRLEGVEGCALLDNYACEQQTADLRIPCVLCGRRELKAKATSISELNGDKQRPCDFDDFSAAVMSKASWQKDNKTAHSLVGSLEGTTSSTQISIGGDFPSKYTTQRRRRQRGSSISAVLPPDLQGVVGDSLAFVKISDDPYKDFKQSMYEMIMEKDLEGSMDVEELLYCYLSLNSPEHHELIEEVELTTRDRLCSTGRQICAENSIPMFKAPAVGGYHLVLAISSSL